MHDLVTVSATHLLHPAREDCSYHEENDDGGDEDPRGAGIVVAEVVVQGIRVTRTLGIGVQWPKITDSLS